MIRKTLFAAAALATLAVGATASTAEAKAHWDINVDLGGYGYGYPDYPSYPVIDYPPPHHGYHHEVHHYDDFGVSCNEGRWSVRSAGFHNVQVEECYGRSFTYTAVRHGDYFEVRVSRRTGNIISVNEI
jgi:hypothetical protein